MEVPACFVLSFSTVILAAGFCSGSHAAFAENRLALVIGQSAYRAVPPLPNPANDAKAVSQLLGDAGFEVLGRRRSVAERDARKGQRIRRPRWRRKAPIPSRWCFMPATACRSTARIILVPVDVDPKREADIPLQAVRLNDILNTLTSVPSKMRIVLLDACRNNPFPEISKTAGHGLAIVDAKTGAPGTFVSFSTSPGAEAEDGDGADSPYTDGAARRRPRSRGFRSKIPSSACACRSTRRPTGGRPPGTAPR